MGSRSVRIFSAVMIFAAPLLLGNCVSSPVVGYFFTNTNHHISGYGSVKNTLGDGKIERAGKSCTWGSFPITYFIYRPKDANLAEALERGNITKIGVVDRSSFSLMGLFYRECVEVWGE